MGFKLPLLSLRPGVVTTLPLHLYRLPSTFIYGSLGDPMQLTETEKYFLGLFVPLSSAVSVPCWCCVRVLDTCIISQPCLFSCAVWAELYLQGHLLCSSAEAHTSRGVCLQANAFCSTFLSMPSIAPETNYALQGHGC